MDNNKKLFSFVGRGGGGRGKYVISKGNSSIMLMNSPKSFKQQQIYYKLKTKGKTIAVYRVCNVFADIQCDL